MSLLLALLFSLSSPAGLPSPRPHCRLPAEQGPGSLLGSWAKLPITLVGDRAFYRNVMEAQALRAAVKTWNDWAATRGKVAFVLANDRDGVEGGMEPPKVASCAQADYTRAFPRAVGIWRVGRNGSMANSRVTCGRERAKLIADGVQAQTDWDLRGRRIHNASILLNFDYFQANGRPKVDLESLLVHELGHVLGLLHSCNGSTDDATDGTSAPACDESPREFNDAAMFPYLKRGSVRRLIGQNDVDRANCLY